MCPIMDFSSMEQKRTYFEECFSPVTQQNNTEPDCWNYFEETGLNN